MSAIKELKSAIERIHELTFGNTTYTYGPVEIARRFPKTRVDALASIEVRSSHNFSPTEEQRAVLDRVKAAMVASEHEIGVAQMRGALGGFALELESLRAVLPGLAARAAIEAGVVARQLDTERSKAA